MRSRLYVVLALLVSGSCIPTTRAQFGNNFIYLQSQRTFPLSSIYSNEYVSLSALSVNDVYFEATQFPVTGLTSRLELTFLPEGLQPATAGSGLAYFEFDEGNQTAAAVFQLNSAFGSPIATHLYLCAGETTLPEIQSDITRYSDVIAVQGGILSTLPQCLEVVAGPAFASVVASQATGNTAAFVTQTSSTIKYGYVNSLSVCEASSSTLPVVDQTLTAAVAANENYAAVAYRVTLNTISIIVFWSNGVAVPLGTFSVAVNQPLATAGAIENIQLGIDENNMLYILYNSASYIQLDTYQITPAGLTVTVAFVTTNIVSSAAPVGAPPALLQVNKRGLEAYVFAHQPAQYFRFVSGVLKLNPIFGSSTSNVISASINQADTGISVLYGDAIGGYSAIFQCEDGPVRKEPRIYSYSVDTAHDVSIDEVGLTSISNQCNSHGHGTFFGIPFTNSYNLFVIVSQTHGMGAEFFQDARPTSHLGKEANEHRRRMHQRRRRHNP